LRWRYLNGTVPQGAYTWWFRELQAQELRLACPYLDRRLIELVLGTPDRFHPRTFHRGEYKPVITRGLGRFVPRSLTERYWKVVFQPFSQHVLRHSLVAVRALLSGLHGGLLAAYVREKEMETLLRACDKEHNLPEVVQNMSLLQAIMGLLLWLEDVRS
jgi:Asparagine synthase